MLGFDQDSLYRAHGFAEKLLGAIDGGSSHLLTGLVAGEVCGICVLEPEGNPTSAHIAHVKKAYIAPEARGGEGVWRMAGEIARKSLELGSDRLLIDVREGEPAARLWEAMGFEVYGSLADYSRFDGRQWAGLFMTTRAEDLLARVGERRRPARSGRVDQPPGASAMS